MLLSEINRSVDQKTYMYQHVIFVKKLPIYVKNKRKKRHNKMLTVVIAGEI